MKKNRINMATVIVILLFAVVVLFYYILLPWTNIDTASIKKELPAATGQPGFHYGSNLVFGLYQTAEVISNER